MCIIDRHSTVANYNFVKNILKKEEVSEAKIADVKTANAKLFLIKMQSDGKGYSLSLIHILIEYMLSSVPEEYDISVGSFFYDLLYPVAEQIYLLQKRISRVSENTFAVTAE